VATSKLRAIPESRSQKCKRKGKESQLELQNSTEEAAK